MAEQRIQTIKIVWKGDEAKGKAIELSRAVAGVDDTVEKLNKTMGENVKVEAKSNINKKEKQQLMRKEYAEGTKLLNQYQSITSNLKKQIGAYELSKQEQVLYNAQLKLGRELTAEQKAEISSLSATLLEKQAVEEKAAQASAKMQSLFAKARADAIAQTKAEIIENEKLAAQQERNKEAVNQIITSYQNQIKAISMSGEEQAVFNAQLRLGANATAKQKEQVSKLASTLYLEAKAQRAANSAAGNGTKSFRNMRGVAQNLGWQLQDTIVQLQMGTNGLVVLSQQGSQFASAFGPSGAVVGAVIALAGAIGGSLLPTLFEFNGELDKLEQRKMSELFELEDTGANIELMRKRVAELNKEIGLYQDLSQVQPSDELGEAEALVLREAANKKLEKLNKLIKVRDALIEDLTKKEADLRAEESGIFDQLDKETEARKELIKQRNVELAAQKAANNTVIGLFNSQATALAKSTETTAQEYDRRKAYIDSYVQLIGFQDEKSAKAYVDLEKWKTTELVKEADKRQKAQDAETKRRIDEASQPVSVSSDPNVTSAYIELAKAEADHNAKMQEIADKYYDSKVKSHDRLLAEQRRYNNEKKALDEELQKAKDALNNRELLNNSIKYGTMNTDLIRANQTFERQKQLHVNTVKAINNDQTLNEQQKNDQLKAANTQFAIAQNDYYASIIGSYASLASSGTMMMSNLVNELSDGVESVRNATENMNDAQKAMFFLSRAVSAAQALVSGMTMGSKMAEFTMNPAWIGIGTAMGAASAGAIMGTTFAGMFDKGGVIPSGQAGIVSEFGDELVGGTMVYNNSNNGVNVTGREDTAKLLANSGNGEGGVALNVQVMNYANGVTHDVERMDENTVRIIAREEFNKNIDSGVASVLDSNNSKASKSINRNYSSNRRV